MKLKNTSLKNNIIENDDYAIMVISTKHENKPLEIIIDKEDIPKIQKYKWSVYKTKSNTYYVVSKPNKHTMRLHRYILNYTGNDVVDHISNDTLDNRKTNLRIVSCATNNQNRRGTGIYQNKSGSWFGIVNYFGKRYYSGSSKYMDVAIEKRNIKIKELETQKEKLAKEYYTKQPERNIEPTQQGKWKATYTDYGKTIHLGYFNTKKEAIQARDEAEAAKLKRRKGGV